MKILYAVQATGNGHLSRANEILPYLQSYGDVDVFVSGDMSSIDLQYPVKFRSKGLSLRWKECGNVDFLSTMGGFEFNRLRKEIKDLPVERYDLVINDFEYIAAAACRRKKVPSVQMSHQASFASGNTPRPIKKSLLGETILKHYAPSKNNIGLHFESYDDFILEPIIRREIKYAHVSDQGHICIYLPSYPKECFDFLQISFPDYEFHIFTPYVTRPFQDKNCHFFPPSAKNFSASMIHSTAVITGGGFETPAEALYLGKRLISIPIRNHYEQQCNAAALKLLGVPILNSLNELTPEIFYPWVKGFQTIKKISDTSVPKLLDRCLQLVDHNSSLSSEYEMAWSFV
jgi:uncharacterized protein (TIGR00661 family)